MIQLLRFANESARFHLAVVATQMPDVSPHFNNFFGQLSGIYRINAYGSQIARYNVKTFCNDDQFVKHLLSYLVENQNNPRIYKALSAALLSHFWGSESMSNFQFHP
jgi:hypothetical protein